MNSQKLKQEQIDCILKTIKSAKYLKILTEENVDALIASSIFAKYLIAKGKQYHISVYHNINEDEIVLQLSNDVKSENMIPEIILKRGNTIICKISPEDLGIEPGFASLSLLAKEIIESIGYTSPNFLKLVIISGISLGHDSGTLRALKSNYKEIIDALKEQNILKIEKLPIFFGFSAIPLIESMITTIEPFIKGISGNEKTCTSLLTRLGISTKSGDEWRRFIDLTKEERQNLVSAIIEEALLEESKITEMDLIAENYIFLDEEEKNLVYDARSFYNLIKTCVYAEKYGEAVVISMGERGRILRNTQEFTINYKIALATTLNKIISENNITKIAWSQVIEIQGKYNHDITIELLEQMQKLKVINGNHPTILNIIEDKIVYIANMIKLDNEFSFMKRIADDLEIQYTNVGKGIWKYYINDRDPNDVISLFNQNFDKIMREEEL